MATTATLTRRFKILEALESGAHLTTAELRTQVPDADMQMMYNMKSEGLVEYSSDKQWSRESSRGTFTVWITEQGRECLRKYKEGEKGMAEAYAETRVVRR